MKQLLKLGSTATLLVSLFFTGPALFEGQARASVGNSDAMTGSLVKMELEKVTDRLIRTAGGNCSFKTGCPGPKNDPVPAPLRREGDPGLSVEVSTGNTEVTADGKVGNKGNDKRGSGGGDILPTVPRFQILTHVIGSHLAIVTRPVTAGKRLLFLLYDTIKDAAGWPAVSQKADKAHLDLSGKGTMDLDAWERRLDEMTGSETSYGTLDFLVDGEEFFPRFFQSVAGARHSVKIRTYIFDNDDFAIKVGKVLRDRSRGVDVRILMDGLGTIMATGVRPHTLPPGHETPLSVRRFLTDGSKVKVRQQVNTWFTGDHSKMVIVDDEKAFVGGMNFGREYRYEWHDLMVEVSGPVVGQIEDDFGKAWAGAGLLGDLESLFHSLKKGPERRSPEGYPVRLLYTRPGNSQIRNTQLEAIRRSRSYVYLQNPYLTDDRVLNELVKASRRGVDVRVVIPEDAESGIINRSNVLAANRMVKNGIRVFIMPRMSHVKAAVYDGWACFGSANYDKLSFRVNYEVNLATSHEPAVRKLIDRLFIPDFNASVEMTEEAPVKAHDYLLELVADQL